MTAFSSVMLYDLGTLNPEIYADEGIKCFHCLTGNTLCPNFSSYFFNNRHYDRIPSAYKNSIRFFDFDQNASKLLPTSFECDNVSSSSANLALTPD